MLLVFFNQTLCDSKSTSERMLFSSNSYRFWKGIASELIRKWKESESNLSELGPSNNNLVDVTKKEIMYARSLLKYFDQILRPAAELLFC